MKEEELAGQLAPPPKRLPPPRGMGGQTEQPTGNSIFLQMLDRLIQFDPTKHARDPGGQGGGQFVSMGEQLSKAAGFVSPSVKSDLDFKGAQRELNSRQQARLRAASADINNKVGLKDVHDVNIIGAWKDGAENSVMSRSASDWDRVELASVMKGYIADQKAVLVFEQQADGKATLAQFNAKGTLATIHKNLLMDGIENQCR